MTDCTIIVLQNIMTKVVLLSSLHSLLISASTLVVPTLTTEDENNATNDSCLDDPYSLPLGVIILDTRDYSTLNATKPVTVGSKHHFGNSCAEANIRRQPSWSRVRKATRDKRSDCAKGNYKNKRMCDYNPRRIPAAIDMVDCGKCDTAVGSLPQTTCRINGLRGTWRPKTIDILLPFLTSTGVYKLKKQEIAVGCHCHITSSK